jgi:peptidoglycan/xylan/chitin deacetylase (PgdA/CDA1 family)
MPTRVFLRVRSTVAFITSLSLLVSTFALPVGTAFADTEVFTSNPGFETGTGNAATGWTQGSFGTITASYTIANGVANVHSGNKAGSISVSAAQANSEAKWLSPAITVTAGQALNVSDYYKSTVVTSVYVYDNIGGVTWVGDAAASPSAFAQFHGQTYLVPSGVTSIQIGHTISAVGTLVTDDYSLLLSTAPTAFTQGLVTLTFDDGWQSFWDVASSSLNSHNLKATEYIITGPDGSNIGDTPNDGYMSTAEITALQAAGFDIAAHTRAHLDLAKDDPTTHGYADRNAMWTGEISGSKSDLTSHSFSPVDSFAYPYGSYCAPSLGDCQSATTQSAGAVNVLTPVKNAGFLGARSVDQGYNLAGDLSSDNKFKLKMQHVTNNTTAAEINGWIDFAVQNKVWLILMFHQVHAGNEATGAANAQCIEPVLDVNGNEVAGQTQADVDCTTSGVLSAVATHAALQPAGTVRTMHEVLSGNLVPPAVDITPPTITLPASPMTVMASSSTSTNAVVNFTATASDTNPANPAVTCTPASGTLFNLGSTTVTCTAADAANNHATSTFVVFVTKPVPVNASPVAQNISTSTLKNTSVSLTLTATDTDSTILTFATSSNPTHGTISGTGASITYTPATDYIGADTFTFTANDGTSTSNAATVSINVTALPNHIPVVTTQNLSTVKNTALSITLAGTDADNDVLTFATTSNPAHGTLTGSTTLTYTPNAEYVGGDSFSFTASDATSTSAAVTVSITVTDIPVTPPAPSGGSSSSGGGGGGGGGGIISGPLSVGFINSVGGGSVLGTSTVETPGNPIAKFLFKLHLKRGSKHNEVTELQKRLLQEGSYNGPVTGYFGPLTQAGVKKYQSMKNIDQVGEVGPKTRNVLNK